MFPEITKFILSFPCERCYNDLRVVEVEYNDGSDSKYVVSCSVCKYSSKSCDTKKIAILSCINDFIDPSDSLVVVEQACMSSSDGEMYYYVNYFLGCLPIDEIIEWYIILFEDPLVENISLGFSHMTVYKNEEGEDGESK